MTLYIYVGKRDSEVLQLIAKSIVTYRGTLRDEIKPNKSEECWYDVDNLMRNFFENRSAITEIYVNLYDDIKFRGLPRIKIERGSCDSFSEIFVFNEEVFYSRNEKIIINWDEIYTIDIKANPDRIGLSLIRDCVDWCENLNKEGRITCSEFTILPA